MGGIRSKLNLILLFRRQGAWLVKTCASINQLLMVELKNETGMFSSEASCPFFPASFRCKLKRNHYNFDFSTAW